MTQATAQLKYLRIAPRKVRFVADLIRRAPVSEAEAQLMLLPRKSGEHLLKLLRSAVANARQAKLDVRKLYVKEIRVDEGPKLKRWNPRAQGRAAEIQKKMSHVTLVLAEGNRALGREFIIAPKEKKQKKEYPSKAKKTPTVKHEKEERKENKKEGGKGGGRKFFQRKSV